MSRQGLKIHKAFRLEGTTNNTVPEQEQRPLSPPMAAEIAKWVPAVRRRKRGVPQDDHGVIFVKGYFDFTRVPMGQKPAVTHNVTIPNDGANK